MNEWKAIAIVSIWVGVGISSLKSESAATVAFWAMWATVIVAMA